MRNEEQQGQKEKEINVGKGGIQISDVAPVLVKLPCNRNSY
jgi:hypothetical protein